MLSRLGLVVQTFFLLAVTLSTSFVAAAQSSALGFKSEDKPEIRLLYPTLGSDQAVNDDPIAARIGSAIGYKVVARAIPRPVCESLIGSFIAILPASEYVKCSDATALIPILVVDKAGESGGYYGASFYVRRDGPRSLDSTKSLRLALRTPESASGYTLPLIALWGQKVIQSPSLKAARAAFASVETFSSYEDVAKAVQNDSMTIGAAIEITDSTLFSLGRFAVLPADVVVVSLDLAIISDTIAKTLTALGSDSSAVRETLASKPLLIRGFIKWESVQHRPSLEMLRRYMSTVQEADSLATDSRFWSWSRLAYLATVIGLLLIIQFHQCMSVIVGQIIGVLSLALLLFMMIWLIETDGSPLRDSSGLLLLALLMLAVSTGLFVAKGVQKTTDQAPSSSQVKDVVVAVVGSIVILVGRATLFESVGTIDALFWPPTREIARVMVLWTVTVGLLSSVASQRYAGAITRAADTVVDGGHK